MSVQRALIANHLAVQFGGLKVLTDLSIKVEPGEIVGLIGPNGAGKTTVLNILTGFLRATAGNAFADGVEITGRKPYAIRRMGVSRTFQAGRLFKELTVFESVTIGGVGLGLSRRAAEAEAERVLEWLSLTHLAERSTAGLTYTDQRRVAIARASVLNPAYLLLDEPAAGMSESESRDLGNIVARIATELGTGVLLIEHNLALVLDICRDIHVLDAGRIIEAGSPEVIRQSQAVRHAYIGSALDDLDTDSGEPIGRTLA